MEPQFIITIGVALAALIAGAIKGLYWRAIPILMILSVIAGRWAYPREREDAMWMIGASLAFTIDTIAIFAGMILGCIVYWLRHNCRWVGPPNGQ